MSRKSVLLEDEPGLYHCVSRCVRRAFLCGVDSFSGRDYSHRKGWIQQRLRELSRFFLIEVCSYSVMSNHVHLVLKTDPGGVREWSNREVARRWFGVFPGGLGRRGQTPEEQEIVIQRFLENVDRVNVCRERLGDLSWFMRCLNERIARMANKEDECKGRFWEGRFKCQRLADRGAILACMAYVDLNPVRACLAETPETSEFTSVYDRIVAHQGREKLAASATVLAPAPMQEQMLQKARQDSRRDAWLCPMANIMEGIPGGDRGLDLEQYLALIDWTGRAIHRDKPGVIPARLCSILLRLELDVDNWVKTVNRYGGLFHRVAGKAETLIQAARKAGQKWLRGMHPEFQIYRSRTASFIPG